MDHRSFDRLVRMLGEAHDRRSGLRAVLGGLLAAGGLAALDDAAEAKRKHPGRDRRDPGSDADQRGGGPAAAGKKKNNGKKKKNNNNNGKDKGTSCDPPCKNGFTCDKTKGRCVCLSGISCRTGFCCEIGQICSEGACIDKPAPATCVEAGKPCNPAGMKCCAGRTCAAGQGGNADIACYVSRDGACSRTSDCVAGMSCSGGRCQPSNPVVPTIPTGDPCTIGQSDSLACANPNAACRAGDVETALRCRLDAGGACGRDKDCVTEACRDGRCAARHAEPCGDSQSGAPCRDASDQCGNLGTVQNPAYQCRSIAGTPCSDDGECASVGCSGPDGSKVCDALTTEPCGGSPEVLCRHRDTTDTCTSIGGTTTCLRAAGIDCAKDAQCISGACDGGVCKALTGEPCGDSNYGAVCLNDATEICRKAHGAGPNAPRTCLLKVGVACTEAAQCSSSGCENGVCTALTEEACGGSPEVLCQVTGDLCHDTGSGTICLRPVNTACTSGDECISGGCENDRCQALTGEACGGSPEVTCFSASDVCSDSGGSQTCLRAAGVACTSDDQCASGGCDTVCKAPSGDACGADNNGALCREADDTCKLGFGAAQGAKTRCLRDRAATCTAGRQCYSGGCTGSSASPGVCKAITNEPCGGDPDVTCVVVTDSCSDVAGGGKECLPGGGALCTSGDQCASGECNANGACKARTGEICQTDSDCVDPVTNICVDAGSKDDPSYKCLNRAETVCDDNSQCFSLYCEWPQGEVTPSNPRRCHLVPNGFSCTLDHQCVSGTCGTNGKCAAQPGQQCGPGHWNEECTAGHECVFALYSWGYGAICVANAGTACTANSDCKSNACGGTAPNQVCKAITAEKCGASNNGAECRESTDTCTHYAAGTDAPTDHTYCLRPNGAACTYNQGTWRATCVSNGCRNGICVTCALTDGCDGSTPCCNEGLSCFEGTCAFCTLDGAEGCEYENRPCCNPGAICSADRCVPCTRTGNSGCNSVQCCSGWAECVNDVCTIPEGSCAGDDSSCSEVPCCNPDATCLDGTCRTCMPIGVSGCNGSIPCCDDDLTCTNGTCTGCAPTGGSCINGVKPCCSADDACSSSGVCVSQICIPAHGSGCNNTDGPRCCNETTNICRNGVCTCIDDNALGCNHEQPNGPFCCNANGLSGTQCLGGVCRP